MLTFSERMKLRIKHKEENMDWSLNDKYKAYLFYKNNNLPCPELYTHISDTNLNNIDFDKLPKEFVIKPTVAHSANGVFMLRKTDDKNIFLNILTKSYISKQTLQNIYDKIYNDIRWKNSWKIMVEEYLVAEHNNHDITIDDIKIFCFYDKIAFIWVKNLHDRTSAYFDSEWKIIEKNKLFDIVKAKSYKSSDDNVTNIVHKEPPVHAKEIVKIAKKTAMSTNLPFCRVDLFATNNGPVNGEVTLYPAINGFIPGNDPSVEMDKYMGELWNEALKKLQH